MYDLPSEDVKNLLQELDYDGLIVRRRVIAAERLGTLASSNLEIVQALVSAELYDKNPLVRSAATLALQAPAHQFVIKEHPDYRQAVERSYAADQEFKDEIVRHKFEHRRKNQMMLYILFLVLLFGTFLQMLALIAYTPHLAFRNWFVPLFQAILLVIIGGYIWLTRRNWRCPACDSAWFMSWGVGIPLFNHSIPLYCPSCGTRLL